LSVPEATLASPAKRAKPSTQQPARAKGPKTSGRPKKAPGKKGRGKKTDEPEEEPEEEEEEQEEEQSDEEQEEDDPLSSSEEEEESDEDFDDLTPKQRKAKLVERLSRMTTKTKRPSSRSLSSSSSQSSQSKGTISSQLSQASDSADENEEIFSNIPSVRSSSVSSSQSTPSSKSSDARLPTGNQTLFRESLLLPLPLLCFALLCLDLFREEKEAAARLTHPFRLESEQLQKRVDVSEIVNAWIKRYKKAPIASLTELINLTISVCVPLTLFITLCRVSLLLPSSAALS